MRRCSPMIIVCFVLFVAATVVSLDGLVQDKAQGTSGANTRNGCDQGNGGLTLPAGFCGTVFADNLGRARHLTVAPSGDVYVNTWSSSYTELKNAPGGYLVALRDKNRDGKADQVERFGPVHQDGTAGGGTGIGVHRGALYVEDNGKIVRYRLGNGLLVPKETAEIVLSGLWTERGHIMHPFAITSDGVLYVNSGSITNSCQEKDRTLESPGVSPCPELGLHAGIWRYDVGKSGQTFSSAHRYATAPATPSRWP